MYCGTCAHIATEWWLRRHYNLGSSAVNRMSPGVRRLHRPGGGGMRTVGRCSGAVGVSSCGGRARCVVLALVGGCNF